MEACHSCRRTFSSGRAFIKFKPLFAVTMHAQNVAVKRGMISPQPFVPCSGPVDAGWQASLLSTQVNAHGTGKRAQVSEIKSCVTLIPNLEKVRETERQREKDAGTLFLAAAAWYANERLQEG